MKLLTDLLNWLQSGAGWRGGGCVPTGGAGSEPGLGVVKGMGPQQLE